MQIHFTLTELSGLVAGVDRATNKVQVTSRELVGPTEPVSLADRLERLHGSLFRKIPGLPAPGLIENLLVLIRSDLSATAYVNELQLTLQVKTAKAVRAGEPVYMDEIADIISAKPDIDIPPDVGIVMVRSVGWRRSLFYDLAPILPNEGPRSYALDSVLAQQELVLFGVATSKAGFGPGGPSRIIHMKAGIETLEKLLSDRVEVEAAYQELLAEHPWMLGGTYAEIRRHSKLDDSRIPDFTALRCHDKFHDVIEIKQPFIRLFRENGGFTSDFNDAWNQSEGYLAFVVRQRQYLRDEKNLRFENPRCVLIAGFALDEVKVAKLREKQTFANSISVFTYDHLLETSRHIFELVRTAHDRLMPSNHEPTG
jgi:hypothetical protein